MNNPENLLARLDAIGRALESSGHAEALIGLGSVGRKIDGLPAGRGAHQPVRRAVPLPARRAALGAALHPGLRRRPRGRTGGSGRG